MDIEEIGISAGNQVDSAQDTDYWRALVNATLNLQVPQPMELVNLNLQERDVQGGLGVDERMILEWILKTYVSM